jgi:alpha-tubulin suppressor-like RCC1 family protein
MSALSQYVVKKVAVHSGGKHAMALTVDGRVFSWGNVKPIVLEVIDLAFRWSLSTNVLW